MLNKKLHFHNTKKKINLKDGKIRFVIKDEEVNSYENLKLRFRIFEGTNFFRKKLLQKLLLKKNSRSGFFLLEAQIFPAISKPTISIFIGMFDLEILLSLFASGF